MTSELYVIDWAITLGGAAVAYAWVLRRSADIVQPVRLRLAVLGERIIASDPSDERRNQISFYLNNAFNGWISLIAAFVTPVILISFIAGLVFNMVFDKSKLPRPPCKEDAQMGLLFTCSIVAANPLFGVVMVLEMMFFGIVVALIGGLPSVPPAFSALLRTKSILPVPTRSLVHH